MNRLSPEAYWQRFAAAARQPEVAAPPQPGTGQVPSGFVQRVVARAMQARREFSLLLWERWSWRAALAAALGAVVLGGLVLRHARQSSLDVPSGMLEVPQLQPP